MGTFSDSVTRSPLDARALGGASECKQGAGAAFRLFPWRLQAALSTPQPPAPTGSCPSQACSSGLRVAVLCQAIAHISTLRLGLGFPPVGREYFETGSCYLTPASRTSTACQVHAAAAALARSQAGASCCLSLPGSHTGGWSRCLLGTCQERRHDRQHSAIPPVWLLGWPPARLPLTLQEAGWRGYPQCSPHHHQLALRVASLLVMELSRSP